MKRYEMKDAILLAMSHISEKWYTVPEIKEIANLPIEERYVTMLCNGLFRAQYLQRAKNDYKYCILDEGVDFIEDGGYAQVRKLQLQEKILSRSHIRSTIDTNDSVIRSNDSQIKFANRSLILGSITTAFILVTIIQQLLDTTQQQLRGIEQSMKKQDSTLTRIALSLEQIGSSMYNLGDSLP